MIEVLKRIYRFLFWKHDIGFMLLCYAMLIPCALSEVVNRWWLWFMCFVLVLATHANVKGWNRMSDE